ncbi:MAG: hypothetical protein EOO89_27440 [Pedobacter sp.]|nr:MAG: hypothetical protein EOO89_27440 [Pedobacter sp.]
MEGSKEVIILAIVISSLTIIVFAVFALLFFTLFVKKKKRLQADNERLHISYAQALLQSQLEIQEQTLLNVSREIHDNIGQVLSLVSLNLHTLESPDKAKISNTSELVTKAIEDLRSLSKSMNSERVLQLGLKESLKQELLQLEKTGKYLTAYNEGKQLMQLSHDRTIILFRMIQEVINNIIKHASASYVTLSFFPDEENSSIIISDNGVGFDMELAKDKGLGLQNLQQRAMLINAKAEIISGANGTTVKFALI